MEVCEPFYDCAEGLAGGYYEEEGGAESVGWGRVMGGCGRRFLGGWRFGSGAWLDTGAMDL